MPGPQRQPNFGGYDLMIDMMVKHLERVDEILDKQNDINQKLSNDQAVTKTRLDILMKIVVWIAGIVASLAIAVAAGIIVYWLTHPH